MESIHFNNEHCPISLIHSQGRGKRWFRLLPVGWVFGWVGLAALFGLPGAFPAAMAATSTETLDYQRAQTLFQQGRQLAIQKQYEQALARYTDAIALLKNAEQTSASSTDKARYRSARAGMLFIVGRTHQLNKQPAMAYRAYLRCRLAGPAPKLGQLVDGFIARLRPHMIARLQLTTTPLGVAIRITDAIGQVQRTTSPMKQEVPPGMTHLQLQYPGYQSQQITLQLAPNSTTIRNVRMQRTQQTLPPPRQPAPSRPTSGATIGMWSSFAVAGVAAIAGISLLAVGIPQEQSGLVCYGQVTKAECANQTDTTIADAIEGGQTLKFAGIALLAVSGLAVGAAVFFYFQRPKAESPRTRTPQNQPDARLLLDTRSP